MVTKSMSLLLLLPDAPQMSVAKQTPFSCIPTSAPVFLSSLFLRGCEGNDVCGGYDAALPLPMAATDRTGGCPGCCSGMRIINWGLRMATRHSHSRMLDQCRTAGETSSGDEWAGVQIDLWPLGRIKPCPWLDHRRASLS